MTEREKKFQALRAEYALDNGSVDDVVEKLEGEHEVVTNDENYEYVTIDCPFRDEFECKYGLVEDWHGGDDEDAEFLYITMAAHMLTAHLELEE